MARKFAPINMLNRSVTMVEAPGANANTVLTPRRFGDPALTEAFGCSGLEDK